jgi:hypothetical protein
MHTWIMQCGTMPNCHLWGRWILYMNESCAKCPIDTHRSLSFVPTLDAIPKNGWHAPCSAGMRPGSDRGAFACAILDQPVGELTTNGHQRTADEAQDRARQREPNAAQHLDARLAQLGWITNIDFSTFDLDQPVGELTTNGHQQSLAQSLRKAGKRTLREAIISYTSGGASIDLVATPDQVAAQMGEVMEEVGGDGFLFPMPNVNRRTIAEITDGLVPALQQPGPHRVWRQAPA